MSITKKMLAILGLIVLTAIAVPVGAGASPAGTPDTGPDWTEVDPQLGDGGGGYGNVGSSSSSSSSSSSATCDQDSVVGAQLMAIDVSTVSLFHNEVIFGSPAVVDWYDRGRCEYPRVRGTLSVFDIGPTCARVKVETFSGYETSVGHRTSDPVCQDLDYGNDSLYLTVIGVGEPNGNAGSVEITTQIQNGDGEWIDLRSQTASMHRT